MFICYLKSSNRHPKSSTIPVKTEFYFSLFTQGGVMPKKMTLFDLVRQECCNFVSDECLGTNVNGNRLKRNSKTTIIYQYPYELEYKNAGLCWVQEGITCDYFEQAILPSGNVAIAEKYEECVSGSNIEEQEPRLCKCGNILSDNERKCAICKRKTRRLRNSKFRGSK